MHTRCGRRCRRNKLLGTTLLEVLLGLAILATLLTSVVIARGRFMRQWADADRRSRLLAAADHLMEELSKKPTRPNCSRPMDRF